MSYLWFFYSMWWQCWWCQQNWLLQVSLAFPEGKFYKTHPYRERLVFWGVPLFKLNNLVLVLGMAFKFHSSVVKGWKLKVRKFLELFLATGEWQEKIDRAAFFICSNKFSILIFVHSHKKGENYYVTSLCVKNLYSQLHCCKV